MVVFTRAVRKAGGDVGIMAPLRAVVEAQNIKWLMTVEALWKL